MLYEGETLEEVFSKAFGKPIGKYGKKPGGKKPSGKKPGSFGKVSRKPTSYGKQGEEARVDVSPAHLNRLRRDATSRPFWVLVWAHSHPGRRSRGASNYLSGLSRTLGRDDDDHGLLLTAPVLIKHPNGWQPHTASSYRQFSR